MYIGLLWILEGWGNNMIMSLIKESKGEITQKKWKNGKRVGKMDEGKKIRFENLGWGGGRYETQHNPVL